ncbi:carbon-nitrogen family hydrolase [Lapillicoccus sp.]|uniref:carbon-nitrogen family hydrolase n=1 Tax=Lapillicoccus sp. TaxID=1909287 RepID=UPI0025FC7913|nr:carbon-nitrogen family hydrolase [Lapillicoccus sp.]
MKVALIQLAYSDDESVADRVTRVAGLVREQRGHDLVVLPELWAAGGFDYRHWAERAETTAGAIAEAMGEAAKDAGVTLLAGSIVETTPDGSGGPEGKNLWNTALLFDPTGGLVRTYRKIHRFGFGAGEPRLMEAGEELVLADLPVAGGDGADGADGADGVDGADGGTTVRAGISTCYDLRFPELYRAQLDRGARLFVIPAAWPRRRVDHWTLLAQARAIENQCVVIACNTAGTHARHEMGGHSQVIGAAGEPLATAGLGEEVLSVDIDLAAIDLWRGQFPVLGDRRMPDHVR